MPGLATRRNIGHLAPIQTSFQEKLPMAASRDTAVASEPVANIKPQPLSDFKPTPAAEPLPRQSSQSSRQKSRAEPPLKPARSRSSLFDLFSKPNVERSRAHREVIPPVPALPAKHKPATGERLTLSKTPTRPVSQEEPAFLSPKVSRPQLRTAKSARSLRPGSKKESPPSRHGFKPPWHPPPLFQAYPQAVMHTSLEAPTPSPALPAAAPAADDKSTALPPSSDGPAVPEEAQARPHRFFGRMKSRSRLREDARANELALPANPPCSRKVYVLATAGYLLQYAGDGPFDRLPEKILKLGPDSVAIASDAIEGKHWVLEVLQTAKADEYTLEVGHKTFLSRLGMQTPHARRLVSSMLLVFAAPDEMDSWMTSIRNEIGVDGVRPGIALPQLPSIKRYSSIIRLPNSEAGHPSPALNSTRTSPTAVSSQRASSTLVASASSASFPSRFSTQLSPNYLSGEQRPLSAISQRSELDMIGPALKSPGFFERQRTPKTAEFPDWAWASGIKGQDSPNVTSPLNRTGSNPHYYSKTLDRQRSMQSISSKSSNTLGDPEGIDFKQQAIQHRHSIATLANRTEDVDARSSSFFLPVPSPSLPHFPEPPRRSVTMPGPSEMDTIAESPPPPNPREARHPLTLAAVDTLAQSAQSTYTRASASFTPGAATLTTGTRLSKRNSVFARPIPIATSSLRTTSAGLSASPDHPVRRTSMRDTPPLSRRSSGRHQEASSSPDSTIVLSRPSQDKTLRRPASININSDIAPFLSAPKASPRSPVRAPTRTDSLAPQSAPTSKPSPARSSSRSRASASYANFPPPRPPPTMPLPPPPVTTH